MTRRLAALIGAATVAVALAAAPAAQADSSDVTRADIQLRLADDASLLVAGVTHVRLRGVVRGLVPRHRAAAR